MKGPVVILGGGYVGSTLTHALTAKGVPVRLVSRSPGPATPGVERIVADATVRDTLMPALAGATAVVHLLAHMTAGRSWRVADDDPQGRAVNVASVTELINSVADTNPAMPVVLAGTTAVARVPDSGRLDGTEPDEPSSAYDAQKLEAERHLLDATRDGLCRGVALRLPTVFGVGPGTTSLGSGVVVTVMRRAFAGKPLTVWGDGSIVRDLVHVGDAAAAFDRALVGVDAVYGRSWLVGTGQPVTLANLFTRVATAVAEHTGNDPVPITSVDPPPYATPGDMRGAYVATNAFGERCGWKPRRRLDEALSELAERLAPADNHVAARVGAHVEEGT